MAETNETVETTGTAETAAPETKPAKASKKKAAEKKPAAKKPTPAGGLKKTDLPMTNLIHPDGGCIIKSAKVNQRDQFPALTAKGWPLFAEHEIDSDKKPVVEMLLSADPMERKEAIDILDELAPKVKSEYGTYVAEGILQNIEIRLRNDGYGDLVSGNLRTMIVAYAYAVSGGKGKPMIPARVVDIDDKSASLRSTIENMSRYNESEIDEATRFASLKKWGWTPKAISDATGGRIGYQTVLDRLKLLSPKIPEEVRQQLREGKVSAQRVLKKYVKGETADRPEGTDGVRMPKYKDAYKQYLAGKFPDGETKMTDGFRRTFALHYLQIPEADYKSVSDCKEELDGLTTRTRAAAE